MYVTLVTIYLPEHSYFRNMRSINKESDRSEKLVIWFSRLVRWSFGVVFIVSGIVHYDSKAWLTIAFGAVILITGFLKPKRCIGGCPVDQRESNQI